MYAAVRHHQHHHHEIPGKDGKAEAPRPHPSRSSPLTYHRSAAPRVRDDLGLGSHALPEVLDSLLRSRAQAWGSPRAGCLEHVTTTESSRIWTPCCMRCLLHVIYRVCLWKQAPFQGWCIPAPFCPTLLGVAALHDQDWHERLRYPARACTVIRTPSCTPFCLPIFVI